MNRPMVSFTILTIVFLVGGCRERNERTMDARGTPKKGIIAVQEAHAGELMKIPGVVGIYVGARDDGTPAIRVMVKSKTRELTRKIPADLEGYPVEIEETGEIRPMK